MGTTAEHDGGLSIAKIILDYIDKELPPLSLEETGRFIRYAILLGKEAAIEAFTGHRPLNDASTNGFAPFLESLPDPNLGDELESEPIDIIHQATETSDQPTVPEVLDRVEKLGFLRAARFAPVHAAGHKKVSMCKFLVERGALDDNLPDGSGDD